MLHLALLGEWEGASETLAALLREGYSLRMVQAPRQTRSRNDDAVKQLLVVATLVSSISLAELEQERPRHLPWFAVDLTDDPAVIAGAYAAGAIAVIAAAAAPAALPRAIQSARSILPAFSEAIPLRRQRAYRSGTPIAVAENECLEVERGIVGLWVTHDDGAESLLGLFGQGQLLVGHPADGCHVRFTAHADATVRFAGWQDAQEDPKLCWRLRGRLREMEAWAAIQAQPHIDERILGILALLAGQFGRPAGESLLVDVRVTHTMLAAAVGATRATVTRAVGGLRRRGALSTTGAGVQERYRVHEWRRDTHLPLP